MPNRTSPGPMTTIRERYSSGEAGLGDARRDRRAPAAALGRNAAEQRLEHLHLRRRRDRAEERVVGRRLPGRDRRAEPAVERDVHVARGHLGVEPADDAAALGAREQVLRLCRVPARRPMGRARGCTAGCRCTRSSRRRPGAVAATTASPATSVAARSARFTGASEPDAREQAAREHEERARPRQRQRSPRPSSASCRRASRARRRCLSRRPPPTPPTEAPAAAVRDLLRASCG